MYFIKYFKTDGKERFSSVQFSHLVVSNSLRPHGLQHARLPCPTNSQSLLKLMSIEWVMSSNHLILCCPLLLLPSIFPGYGSFLMSQLFASDGHCTGVSASASVLTMNIQGWFPLGLTVLTPLQFKELSTVFFSTTIEKHQFFSAQPSLWYNSHIYT